LDEGSGARVVARLIEVDLASGEEIPRLTFDSNAPNVPVRKGYQLHQVIDCKFEVLDFMLKAYYIEATLTTSAISAASAAGIQVIQLRKSGCSV
ncbi:MAG: hypothetical protein M3P29_08845, partial [Acidobacteriota bacterium]|nr:hypothetical protein [Acidobacteriota bacterium]